MIYNKERHKQLVIRSQYFMNQGKTLFIESPEEYSELLNYKIAVEEQVYWDHRKDFFLDSLNLVNVSQAAYVFLFYKSFLVFVES